MFTPSGTAARRASITWLASGGMDTATDAAALHQKKQSSSGNEERKEQKGQQWSTKQRREGACLAQAAPRPGHGKVPIKPTTGETAVFDPRAPLLLAFIQTVELLQHGSCAIAARPKRSAEPSPNGRGRRSRELWSAGGYSRADPLHLYTSASRYRLASSTPTCPSRPSSPARPQRTTLLYRGTRSP